MRTLSSCEPRKKECRAFKHPLNKWKRWWFVLLHLYNSYQFTDLLFCKNVPKYFTRLSNAGHVPSQRVCSTNTFLQMEYLWFPFNCITMINMSPKPNGSVNDVACWQNMSQHNNAVFKLQPMSRASFTLSRQNMGIVMLQLKQCVRQSSQLGS